MLKKLLASGMSADEILEKLKYRETKDYKTSMGDFGEENVIAG